MDTVLLAAVELLASAVISFSAPGVLLQAPLPVATIEATGPVVVLPAPDAGQVRAIGEMRAGQRGEVFAVSGDMLAQHVWLSSNGMVGVTECEYGAGRFLVRSARSGRVLARC